MQRNMISVAALTLALSALPTFAQSPSPTSDQQMVSGQFPTQLKDGEWRGSKLNGLDVCNNNAEKIGAIEDLIVDQSGKIRAFVIGVGGFLGIGKHQVALPFDEVKLANEPVNPASFPGADGTRPADPQNNTASTTNIPPRPTTAYGLPDYAVVNMTKEQLKAAPQFKYASNE